MSGTVSAKSLIGELKRKRLISPLAGKLAPKKMSTSWWPEGSRRKWMVCPPSGTENLYKIYARALGTSTTWTHL